MKVTPPVDPPKSGFKMQHHIERASLMMADSKDGQNDYLHKSAQKAMKGFYAGDEGNKGVVSVIWKYTCNPDIVGRAMAKSPWILLLCSVLEMVALSIIYAWPVFTTKLTETGWSNTETQLVFSMSWIITALTVFSSGEPWVRRYIRSPRMQVPI